MPSVHDNPELWAGGIAVFDFGYDVDVEFSDVTTIAAVQRSSRKILYSFTARSDFPSPSDERKSDASWIFSAAMSTDANGASMVGKVIDGVNELIAARDFKGIDRALARVPTGNTSKHVLIALARATFPVRTKLSTWHTFVHEVQKGLANRGLDHTRLLKGLIQ